MCSRVARSRSPRPDQCSEHGPDRQEQDSVCRDRWARSLGLPPCLEIDFCNLRMRLPQSTSVSAPEALPAPFRLACFGEPGADMATWARVCAEAGLFAREAEPEVVLATRFMRDFSEHLEDLRERMFFVLDGSGTAVGTATAWAWFRDPAAKDAKDFGHHPGRIHWVSMAPSVQGKGLAKVILGQVICRLRRLHPDRDIFLTTPTTSARAVAMYLELGFQPEPIADVGESSGEFSVEEIAGWTMLAKRFGIKLSLPPLLAAAEKLA